MWRRPSTILWRDAFQDGMEALMKPTKAATISDTAMVPGVTFIPFRNTPCGE